MSVLRKIINAIMALFGYVPRQDGGTDNDNRHEDKGSVNKKNTSAPEVNKPQTFNIIDCDVVSVEEVKSNHSN